MDGRGFARFLATQGASKAEVRCSLVAARRFEVFCRQEAGTRAGEATMDLANAFLTALAERGDGGAPFQALARYARFIGNRRALVAFLGALDGHRTLCTLRGRVEAALGPAGGELLVELGASNLGATSLERAHRMHVLVDRLELLLGREQAAALLV